MFPFFLFFLSRPSFQSFFPNGIFRSFVFLFFLITGNQIQKWNSKKNPSIFQNSFPRFIKYQSIYQSVFEKYLCSSRINKWHVTHQLNFITRAWKGIHKTKWKAPPARPVSGAGRRQQLAGDKGSFAGETFRN